MLQRFARPLPLVLFLGIFTAIPVLLAIVTAVQVPAGAVPEDSLRLAIPAPVSLFLHALSGALFGLLGPLQFARSLRQRFGRLHRLSGRIFVLAGAGLGLSAHSLLWQVSSNVTPLLDTMRGLAGTALLAALGLGLAAALRRDIPRHRAWMIRAYAIGMGSGTIALVFFPIYLISGSPPSGLASDLVFVGWWACNIGLAEAVIRRALPTAPDRAPVRAPDRAPNTRGLA